MMKKLPFVLILLLMGVAESWAQQTPLTSSYFRNKFLYNPAYTASEVAPRFDILYRQQWSGMGDDGITTTALTAQFPLLTRMDSTGARFPILTPGLGANLMISQDKVGLLSTTAFQIGAVKNFQTLKVLEDSAQTVIQTSSPFSVALSFGGYMTGVDESRVIGEQGDQVLSKYGSPQFSPDATLGFTYFNQANGLEFGFAIRQLLDRGAALDESNFLTKYFNQSFFSTSKYFEVGLLKRVGIEPQLVYKFANELPGQLQLNVVADFWRDWEYGTPKVQAVMGYRTGFGTNFGITVRPTPRIAVSYMYEMSMNRLNKLSKGEVNGGNLGLTHEIMVTYDLRHEKWSLPPVLPDRDETGGGEEGPVEGITIIDSIVLDGKVYRTDDLINDYLGKVTFQPGTAELSDESYEALDKLARMMLVNPAVRIEVGSHTDSLSNQFSLQLTQKRSEAVRSYLQDVKGVQLGRVVPQGYGRTRQEEGKEPERTEFKLLAINEDDDE